MKVSSVIRWGAAVVTVILLAGGGAASAGNRLGSEEAGRYLSEAEAAFREGLRLDGSDPEEALESFERSILYYRELIEKGGVENGKIYYNIANAYFRMGELGRAILNYKRSALYMPNNGNLLQNLEYARSRRLNRIEEREKARIFRTLFFLHYDLPFQARFSFFSISFALAWTAGTLLLFFRSGKLKAVLIVISVISGLLLASLVVEIAGGAGYGEGVIIDEQVTARKGDARTYQPSFTEPLREGTEFQLLEKREGWYHIELANGKRCWIPSSSAETVIE
jgi:hypothetical protein